ncbi:protein bric-a-brac 1-like [Pollicipes pollicipes]|uniref:protein bric-a-brac 1-like n=1 Tax=Pollicipes pollicipes TaxID=41117 RepID=UPI001885209C|nr:protein bric-a-brac 1-like [Pollicipes pollicipes]
MENSQFLLKWNNHQPTVVSVLDYLLNQEAFIDVTLACEGQSFSAHKVILSACSPYFQDLLMKNPCKHPIVFLKDVRSCDMESLLQFMYRGEINVQQDDLAQFLKTAESLQIKGLADNAMKDEAAAPAGADGADSEDDTRDSAAPPASAAEVAERTERERERAERERAERPNPNRSLLATALGKLGGGWPAGGGDSSVDGVSAASLYPAVSMDFEQAGPSRLALSTPPPSGLFPYALTPSPGAVTPAASVKEEPSLGQPEPDWASGASGAGSTVADSPERGSENGEVRDPLDSPEKGSPWASRRWPTLFRPRAAAAAATPFPSPTPLMCKFCGQMFSDASNRFRHEKRHKHPEEVHVCFVCKRPFSRKDNMKKHIKTVHGVSAEAEEPGGVHGGHGNGWTAVPMQAVDMTSGR